MSDVYSAVDAPPVGVNLLAVNLHDVEFKRLKDPDGPLDAGGQLQLAIKVARPNETDLVVHILFRTEHPQLFKASALYGLRFRLEDDADVGDREEYWRLVAAQLAPVIAYPYARETLNSLAAKAGISGLILPVLNVGAIVPPSDISLAPIAEQTGE
ncbi:MAG: hypothetical protein KFH98_15670 [Gemmatimonadetes bacterium]|nr:hypothetical protein [Gemmatimonadota bacterium]